MPEKFTLNEEDRRFMVKWEGKDESKWDWTACHSCKRLTPMHLLDGKDDGTGNFNILECRDCYGEGWDYP